MQMEELKIYLVVNTSVSMGKGKIAAQCGHAVQYLTELCLRCYPDTWSRYCASGTAKIVCRAPLETLEELLATYPGRTVAVRDAGRTQIEPNTLTVVGFIPMTTATTPDVIKRLKLL